LLLFEGFSAALV